MASSSVSDIVPYITTPLPLPSQPEAANFRRRKDSSPQRKNVSPQSINSTHALVEVDRKSDSLAELETQTCMDLNVSLQLLFCVIGVLALVQAGMCVYIGSVFEEIFLDHVQDVPKSTWAIPGLWVR